MSKIIVTYRVTASAEDIERIARFIAVEETVEVPEALIVDNPAVSALVGEIDSTRELDKDRFELRVSYRADLACGHLHQLLNLLYGNISLSNCIRISDIELPDEVLSGFHGPRFGIAGIRERLGVHGRPLIATALKPRGVPVGQLAALAESFARGGGDLLKDDHNLVDEVFDAFVVRVRACQEAINRGNQAGGTKTIYFPTLSAPADQLERYMAAAAAMGCEGILIAPFITGIDTMRVLAAKYNLISMAHPTFSGVFFQDPSHGIEPGVLLGTILRLAGADISIFPNAGGRFSFSSEQCNDIAARLCGPLGKLSPALPMPAGGMQIRDIASAARQYGEDTGLLIGGALLTHGTDLGASTAQLLDELRADFKEIRRTPVHAADTSSSYVIHQSLPDFRWAGCTRIDYKDRTAHKRIPFEGVSRTELFGKSGEQGGFELRYFEIEADGFSSREKHVHPHVIIGARGSGILNLEGKDFLLGEHDVAYVPALSVHQLRNNGAEPFGFYCIVDRLRDRPLDPDA